MSNTMEWLDVG